MKTRHSVLLLLILVICATIGFSFGAYPRFWDQLMGRADTKTVLLLTSEQQNFPPQMAEVFFRETGYDLQIHEIKTPNLFLVEAKNAHLLYAPWEWLEPSKENLQTWPEPIWSELFADFQSSEFFAQKFFPMFWTLQDSSTAKKQFHFEGFATFQPITEGTSAFMKFLVEHKELLKTWILQKKMPSTLNQVSTWPGLPPELKPQAVRQNPLSGISTKEEKPETADAAAAKTKVNSKKK